MNFYLISNSYKSFYLFRREIINELSKKYNVILIANPIKPVSEIT